MNDEPEPPETEEEAEALPIAWSAWRAGLGAFLALALSPEWLLRWLVYWLQDLAIFKFLGLAGRLVILISLVSYLEEYPARREERDNRAWTLIMLGAGKSGDGGRKSAVARLYEDQAEITFLPLGGASIQYWNLRDRNVTESDFGAANIEGLGLENSQADRSNFSRATIDSCRFSGTQLHGALFLDATIIDTSFRGANLTASKFNRVVFLSYNPSVFAGANLTDADFQGARFLAARPKDWPTGSEIDRLVKDSTVDQSSELNAALLCRTVLPGGSIANRDCPKPIPAPLAR